MNSLIKDFFDKHIVQLYQKPGNEEIKFLDMDIDESKESYFTTPLHPEFHNLKTIEVNTEIEMRTYLSEFWKDRPELQVMIPDLVKLAMHLKGSSKEEQTELSPFVYAMY